MKYDPSNPSSAEESIFEPAGGRRLKVKSSVTFHLYVRFVRGCAGSDQRQRHCRAPGPGCFLRVSANLGSVCFLAQRLAGTGRSLINPAAIRRAWWGKPSISLSSRTPNKASCGPRWRTVSAFAPCTVGLAPVLSSEPFWSSSFLTSLCVVLLWDLKLSGTKGGG